MDYEKAFPGKYTENTGFHIIDCFNEGMDIRDYFAAKAMQALINNKTGLTEEQIIERSYEFADIAIEVRNNGQ